MKSAEEHYGTPLCPHFPLNGEALEMEDPQFFNYRGCVFSSLEESRACVDRLFMLSQR